MRKIIMTIGVSLLMVTGVYAQDITLNINNKDVATTVAPVIENQVTLVPLRIISEHLGAKVGWDGPTKTVTIVGGEKEIKLVIGNKIATVNAEEKKLSLAPKIISDTTMVPLRLIGENLGAYVEWQGESRMVIVKSEVKEGRYFTVTSLSQDGQEGSYEGEVILIDGVEIPDGQGTLTFNKGALKGEFVKGEPVGVVTVTLPGIGSMEMNFINGVPDEKMLITLLDGTPAEAELVGGLEHGTMTITVPNLGAIEMTLRNGEPLGKAKLTIPGFGTQEIDIADII